MTDPADLYEAIQDEVGTVLIGKEALVERLTVSLLTRGHILLEGVPGVAKTTIANAYARAVGLDYTRIQMTPDILPADITGTNVYREATGEFELRKGPVFTNLVVADEINRATPKTQAALLEAMQERQVTATGETYDLPEPFFVLATQNPIDQSGTYALPEAQTDRFMMKLLVDYPERDEEEAIVDLYTEGSETVPVERVLTRDEIRAAQRFVRDVPIAEDVREQAVELVRRTRETDEIEFGASPRASMALVSTAKARAFLEGRSHVTEEDIETLAAPVLRHRVILDFRSEREGTTADDVIESLL